MIQVQCRDCGSEDVRWWKTEAGKWYLVNTRRSDGLVYSLIPHAKNCPKRWPDEAYEEIAEPSTITEES
jgi:hypothetical protein